MIELGSDSLRGKGENTVFFDMCGTNDVFLMGHPGLQVLRVNGVSLKIANSGITFSGVNHKFHRIRSNCFRG